MNKRYLKILPLVILLSITTSIVYQFYTDKNISDAYSFEWESFTRFYVEDVVRLQFMEVKEYFGLYSTKAIDTLPNISVGIGQKFTTEMNQMISQKLSDIKSIQIGLSEWPYYNSVVALNGNEFPVQLRIRGDLEPNYNLGLNKASLRFNILDESKIFNGNRWSILMSHLENGIYGMIYYDLMRDEGIISPVNQFVKFHINNEFQGIRILQQAFSQDLLKANKKKNGLIYRAKNDCKDQMKDKNCFFPTYSIYKNNFDSNLVDQQKIADSLLNHFIDGTAIIDDVFDYDKLVRFVVLSEILLAHHSMTCHNLRFYFNAHKRRLEPIAWDPASFIDPPFKGDTLKSMGPYCDKENLPLYRLLIESKKFNRKFDRYRNKYLKDNYILNKMDSLSNKYKVYEPFIDYEGTYRYNRKRVKRNLKRFQEMDYPNSFYY